MKKLQDHYIDAASLLLYGGKKFGLDDMIAHLAPVRIIADQGPKNMRNGEMEDFIWEKAKEIQKVNALKP